MKSNVWQSRGRLPPLAVISADDFGLSDGRNRGIIECFRKGAVTSASVCANGAAFEEAVLLAKQNPGLDIGLHIVLTGEKPLSAPSRIRSLIDKEGRLHKDENSFFWRYINAGDIENEIREQFRKAVSCGLTITHVDGHNHLHVLPGVLPIVIKLCKEYKIRIIRLPYEPPALGPFCGKRLVLGFFCLFARYLIQKGGLLSCDRCYGITHSGSLGPAAFQRIIERLGGGLNEIMTHPACGPKSGYGAEDFATLTSGRVAQAVLEGRIRLSSFGSYLCDPGRTQ
jgi:chitin disaccharide deacetylase